VIRFEENLVERVDAYVARLNERDPDMPWTRGAAVRRLVRLALDREGVTGGQSESGRRRRRGG
jgi:hypothetical protein